MHCQKCGFDNLENATMCQQCGGVFVYSQPTRISGTAITSTILGISGFSMFGVFGITLILGLIFGILALVTWILSLVFGTLALITWILGLAFGMMALNKVGKSGGQIKGKGFAITGITTSASGLAVLLTVIGVIMFINSATTMSLHKKLKAYDGFTATAKAGERPVIEGRVCIINDKSGSDIDCEGVLFVSSEYENPLSIITSALSCAQAGQMPVEVDWQFAGQKDEAEAYNFTITVPVGENSTSVSKKTILYDGKEQVIYEDAQRKIFIQP
ncbi:MAG: DUF4190 domain-containing protein [Phycisphaerae bacterium]|nr:DUF4190 domain-containing protein [Phycisphaerae bacterium]